MKPRLTCGRSITRVILAKMSFDEVLDRLADAFFLFSSNVFLEIALVELDTFCRDKKEVRVGLGF